MQLKSLLKKILVKLLCFKRALAKKEKKKNDTTNAQLETKCSACV